jgi:hypothetical protein
VISQRWLQVVDLFYGTSYRVPSLFMNSDVERFDFFSKCDGRPCLETCFDQLLLALSASQK